LVRATLPVYYTIMFLVVMVVVARRIRNESPSDDVHEMMMSYVCIYRVLYHVLFGVTIEYKVDYLAVQKCHA
jgi:hypothetical protein